MAARLGMKPQQLNRYERGRIPAGDKLSEIARICNVSAHWLLTGEGEQQPSGRGAERSGVYADNWAAALRPIVAGSPIESAIARATVDVEDTDRAWRELSADRKTAVIETLRAMASAAIVLDRLLPKEIAHQLNDVLADKVYEYLETAF